MTLTGWEGEILVRRIGQDIVPERQCGEQDTHWQLELDLLLLKDGRRIRVECKRMDGPRLTSSMRTALEDLEPDTGYGMQYLEAIQSAAGLPAESAA